MTPLDILLSLLLVVGLLTGWATIATLNMLCWRHEARDYKSRYYRALKGDVDFLRPLSNTTEYQRELRAIEEEIKQLTGITHCATPIERQRKSAKASEKVIEVDFRRGRK